MHDPPVPDAHSPSTPGWDSPRSNPGPPRSTRLEVWLLAATLAVAAVVRFRGIAFGLPHTECRPDERQLVNLATRIAAGDLNPHYFIWPSLQMYVLAALYRTESLFRYFAGTPDLSIPARYLTARALSAVLGTASVYLVWRIAKRLGHEATALVAAVLLAVAFLHVRDSHFGMMDVPMTFGVLTAILVLAGAGLDARRMVLYGAAAGLSTSVKYSAILLTVPALSAIATDTVSTRRLARPLLLTVAFGAATCAAFLIGTPYALLDSEAFLSGTRALTEHVATGHVHEGHTIALQDAGRYYLATVLPAAAGLPVLIAGGAGLLLLAVRRRRDGLALALFVFVWLGVVATGQTVFARYVIPVVPFLCLGAAEAVRWIAQLEVKAPIRIALILLSLAVMVSPPVRQTIWLDQLLARRDSRLVARDWVEQHIAPGSAIWQTGSLYGKIQFSAARYREWSYDEDARRFVRDQDVQDGYPDFIIRQSSPLELYSRVPAAFDAIVSGRYRAVQTIVTGASSVDPAAYDQTDAFFLPLLYAAVIRRPGPEFLVYERVAAR